MQTKQTSLYIRLNELCHYHCSPLQGEVKLFPKEIQSDTQIYNFTLFCYMYTSNIHVQEGEYLLGYFPSVTPCGKNDTGGERADATDFYAYP